MDSAQLRFPTYFPENCPPAEALAEECVLFRLCKGPVLSEKDFVPFYLINPERHKNNVNAYGLSVFKSLLTFAADPVKWPKQKPWCRGGERYAAV